MINRARVSTLSDHCSDPLGADTTIIRRDFSQKGTVFKSQGIAYATIQGLTFQTAPYVPSDASPIAASNVVIDFTPGIGFASQEIMNSRFINAYRGVAIGSYNALNNLSYNSIFDNLTVAIGYDGPTGQGGTYSVFYGEAKNIRGTLTEIVNSVDNTYIYYKFKAEVGMLFARSKMHGRVYLDSSAAANGFFIMGSAIENWGGSVAGSAESGLFSIGPAQL